MSSVPAMLVQLCSGLPLDPLPPKPPSERNPNIPHAPVPHNPLSPAEEQRAVTNALRYFPSRHHQELAPEFARELKKYGHIYMYRFMPDVEIRSAMSAVNGCRKDLDFLPLVGQLKNNQEVLLEGLDRTNKQDMEDMYQMYKDIVDEGVFYPWRHFDWQIHQDWFLKHEAFLLKDKASGQIIGGFNLKPFFPDRSAHICNAGFAVKPSFRGLGALQFMIKAYLRIAHAMGYLASYFTLVFATNEAATGTYLKMGFKQVGLIPKAGLLEGLGYVDAYQYHYDLTTLDDNGCPPGGWSR